MYLRKLSLIKCYESIFDSSWYLRISKWCTFILKRSVSVLIRSISLTSAVTDTMVSPPRLPQDQNAGMHLGLHNADRHPQLTKVRLQRLAGPRLVEHRRLSAAAAHPARAAPPAPSSAGSPGSPSVSTASATPGTRQAGQCDWP